MRIKQRKQEEERWRKIMTKEIEIKFSSTITMHSPLLSSSSSSSSSSAAAADDDV